MVDPQEQADVVVVGLGDAGASAALAAHDAGARVVVLEQQHPEDFRPNSRYAAGFLIAPDDPEAAATYLRGLYAVNGEADELDPDLVDTWVEEAAHNLTWLEAMGCPVRRWGSGGEHVTIPGVAGIGTYQVSWTGGRPGCPLHAFLTHQVERRGIDVRWGTRVERLEVDAGGAVVGVRAAGPDGPVLLQASAVVLASGGYEANERLKRQTLPVAPVHFFGTRRNDGHGLHMAAAVGADIWHANAWPGRLVAHVPASGYEGGVSMAIWGHRREGAVPGGLFVDRHACRFMPEPSRQHAAHQHVLAMDAETLQRPAVPAWWIFDRRRLDAGPLPPTHSGPTGPVGDFTWSSDNTEEVIRGWIRQADTVEGLARTCGLDPDALAATVARYDALCAEGVDHDHGRDPATLTPLDRPPFHAVQLWPGGSHTLGGPRRDARARVVRPDGSPIPGLRSCGELGSMYGLLYPSGGASLTECLAFGRIAGREAAAAAATR